MTGPDADSSMTRVPLDNSKPVSTAARCSRIRLGIEQQICDFIAKRGCGSCMIEEPSP